MNKNSLQFCLYYKGEKDCPPEKDTAFWEIERAFCESLETESGKQSLERYLSEYLSKDLQDFESLDGTPVMLKALLFNRYSQALRPDPVGFQTWYKEMYKR